MGFQSGSDLMVSLILIFFAGQLLAVDEKKFGAEETDPVCAILDDGIHVELVFDVRGKVDGLAVKRDGGLALLEIPRVLRLLVKYVIAKVNHS